MHKSDVVWITFQVCEGRRTLIHGTSGRQGWTVECRPGRLKQEPCRHSGTGRPPPVASIRPPSLILAELPHLGFF